MQMTRTLASVSLFALAGLTACQTIPEDAVIDFAPRGQCDAAYDLNGPTSLTPDYPTGRVASMVVFDNLTKCVVDADGSESAYHVFAMPTSGTTASIMIGAEAEDKRILATKIITLTAEGETVRVFEDEALEYRGPGEVALYRPLDSEAFIVIATDASKIGGRFSFVADDLETVEHPAHLTGRYYDENPAIDMVSRPYSYEGSAITLVMFAEPEETDSAGE